MAKIHGLLYVIVGLFVSIMSWKLDYQKLIFFFYAGLIFILFGVIKLIFNLVKNKANKSEEIHFKSQHQTQRFKYCAKCGSPSRLQDKFCRKCGVRI